MTVGSHLHRGGEGRLTLRQSAPVAEAVAAFSSPAKKHLEKARKKLSGPNPDPGGAYLEAVKAVEAAGRPVVIPDDPLATLGKMNAAMRAKPSKWAVVLPAEKAADAIGRMEALWETPHERHGSDDPDPPVTAEQAQAAFALALGLVDYFTRGLVHRVGPEGPGGN